MATMRTYQRSFNGGEISPDAFGRLDDPKYQTGLATCRNFLPLPHGPVQNRTGFRFVRQARSNSTLSRLIPFTYGVEQTMVLEFGDLYVRFHTFGATLLSGGLPYEVVTPYTHGQLAELRYEQDGDIMTLTHPSHAPRELRRLGATNWTLTTIAFASTLAVPTTPTVTATRAASPTNLRDYQYVVTQVGADGLDESLASAAGTTNITNNLDQSGAVNTIAWTAIGGAFRYNVYKEDNGLFGFIGQTGAATFVDDNIAADISRTPPISQNPFSSTNNYPTANTRFEQRSAFGGTNANLQGIWLTRTGTRANLNYSVPSRDDDAMSFRVSAREINAVRHLVPLADLIVLTDSAEWRITSVNGDAITPSTLSARPQSYVGANRVRPLVVNNSTLFAAARGGHLRELAYNWQAQGYATGDLCLRSPHLFDTLEIVDLAYAKAPFPVVWAVSSNGKLLSLTYVPEQQVFAWAQHDTAASGIFESVCVVAEDEEDILYAVVRRTIGGTTRRYIERKDPQTLRTLAEGFFVDSGLTYSGAPATVISGLGHLEGQTVNVLVDGAEHPTRMVTGGAITLDEPGSLVHVGLPITADVVTLPATFDVGGFGQGRPKNVNRVWLRVYQSSGIFVGPNFGELTEAKQRTVEPPGTPPALKSAELEIRVSPTWSEGGQIAVRQAAPLPLTVVAMTIEASIGG